MLITLKISLGKLGGWTSNGTGASEVVKSPSLAVVGGCRWPGLGSVWASKLNLPGIVRLEEHAGHAPRCLLFCHFCRLIS